MKRLSTLLLISLLLISILQIIPIRVANASSQYIIEFTKIREGIYRVNGKTYYDDFNDGVFNTTLWSMVIGPNGGAYSEKNGYLNFTLIENQYSAVGLASNDPRSDNGTWTIIHDFMYYSVTNITKTTIQTGWGNDPTVTSQEPDIQCLIEDHIIKAFAVGGIGTWIPSPTNYTTVVYKVGTWYRLALTINFTSGHFRALLINLTDGKNYATLGAYPNFDITPYIYPRIVPVVGLANIPAEIHCDNLMIVRGTWNITIIGDPDLSQVSKIELYDTTDKLYASITLTGTEKQVEFYPANLTYPLDGYFKFYDKYGNLIGRAPSSGYMRIWAGDVFKFRMVRWLYRRPITITERSGNNLTDYAVRIDLNSTNFDSWDRILYTNGSDVFFTDINGSLLYYWIEEFNKTAQKAIIWVKVPYIPANGNTTIYMYYGVENTYYTDYHNGSKVFFFFDDFETLKSGWKTYGSGTLSISDGWLEMHVTDSYFFAYQNITFTRNISMRTRVKPVQPASYDNKYGRYQFGVAERMFPLNPQNEIDTGYHVNIDIDTTIKVSEIKGGTGYTLIDASGLFDVSIIHKYELMITSTNITFYIDDLYIGTKYDINITSFINVYLRVYGGGDVINAFDFVLLRNITYPEPVYTIKPEEAISLIFLYNKIGKQMARSTYCEVLNATTKEVILSGYYTSRIPLPTIGTFILKVYYNGILIKNITITIPALLYKLNITLPYINITDYRGLIREVTCSAPQTLKLVEDLNPKFPYSRVKVLINGTGDFTLVYFLNQTPTNINIISNVSVVYNIKNNYLYINGTLHSTAEIIIEDQYLLSVLIKDRLGYYLANHPITINGSKYSSNQLGYVKAYLVPEDYLLDFPTYRGFEFYRVDSITTRPVHIRLSTDKSLTTEYLVPAFITGFKISNITTASLLDLLLRSLLQSSGNSSGNIVVSGYLKDYYDNPLAGRTVYVNVTDLDTGFTAVYTATTEGSGFFETSMIPVSEGKDYRITVVFQGDDTYTRAYYESYYSVPKAVAPAPVGIPYYYYLIAIAIVLILIIAVGFAIRAGKSISLKPRRYLKFRS